ncbi:hypothetical protein [Sphingorhabdus sp. YGSMI21]|uniref:hypothetical protein n=1 Tax=Sphingorhabdus sp. YGSMI21 TaxID=2077182 RepID=UPI0013DD08F9|nr:hypothetical protein [Sphingorhabdus sp. YGSMI21]
MAELCFPCQRAFLPDFITRSREVAKKVRIAEHFRGFAASRETDNGLSNVSAFGG